MTTAVLVINADYQEMSWTRLVRALHLVSEGRAVIEESHDDRWVTSPKGKLPWPKIIRLLQYIKMPVKYGPEPWSKQGVLKRDKHRCCFCGKKATTVEHIHPTSRGGGPRDWMNTAAACTKCNNKKGNRTLRESGMKLIFEPFVPMQFSFGR